MDLRAFTPTAPAQRGSDAGGPRRRARPPARLWSTPPRRARCSRSWSRHGARPRPPLSGMHGDASTTQHAGIAGHLGCVELHESALASAGFRPAVEDVLNLWLPSAVDGDGRLRSWPASCRAGDLVEIVAETDVLRLAEHLSRRSVRHLAIRAQAGPRHGQRRPGSPTATVPHVSDGLPARRAQRSRDTSWRWPCGAPIWSTSTMWLPRGWLGDDRRGGARALILRLHESCGPMSGHD